MKILKTVIRLEVQKGHLKWSISEVSRISGVTRSLIYYYFGQKKHKIMEEASSYLARSIFRIDTPREKDITITDRIEEVLKTFRENPYYFIHFYLHRNGAGEAGIRIRVAENGFLKKLANEFPGLSNEQIRLIYILELGLLAYQDIEKDYILWLRDFVEKAVRATNRR